MPPRAPDPVVFGFRLTPERAFKLIVIIFSFGMFWARLNSMTETIASKLEALSGRVTRIEIFIDKSR